MKNTRLLFIGLLLVAGNLFGQHGFVIHHLSGDITPPANYEEDFQTTVQQGDVFAGKYYRYLQFSAIPTQEQRQQIESMGIELLEYFPSHTYLAAIPEGFAWSALSSYPVRAVIPIPDEHRIHPDIVAAAYPVWAMSGETVELEIIVQKNTPLLLIQTQLKSEGIAVVHSYPHLRRLTIRVEKNKIRDLAARPYILWMEPISPAPIPDDTEGRSLHRSNIVNSELTSGNHYDGTGVVIGLADDGPIGPHIDYEGRLTQFASGSSGSHGDMTSGILMGAGNKDPDIRGMASGADLLYWDISGYPHITNAPSHMANYGMVITSTSYSQGCNSYNTFSHDGDEMIYNNPTLIHVFSAGNNNGNDCGFGAGSQWGNITGGYKQGKNVIATGNLDNVDNLQSSSSRGPSADGRIKPDICANGAGQLSTAEGNNYQVGGGTSAAAPGIAGITAQLYQAYKSLNSGQTPESPLVKACLLNTAHDLDDPGPDYNTGWGRVNSYRALRTLETNQYLKDSVTQGNSKQHTINVPADVAELKVMCYWLDPAGAPGATTALVNDLDITLTDPGLNIHQPWLLDHSPNATSLNAPATTGRDSVNNMEQVFIANPAAGNYTVNISGHAVPQGPQHYYIVYYFFYDDIMVTYPYGGEHFVGGETEKIRWDALAGPGNFNIEYSSDSGMSWQSIAANVSNNLRTYDWPVPAVESSKMFVRVTRSADTGQSMATFNVYPVPKNVTASIVCSAFTRVEWDIVPGAIDYTVFRLGAMYMDSIATTAADFYDDHGVNPNDIAWYSVRANGPGGEVGRRSVAIEKTVGLNNCPTPDDAAIEVIVNPAGGNYSDCALQSTVPVTITIENSATNSLSNIPVRYQLDNGTIVSEIYAGTIPTGGSFTYIFTTPLSLPASGVHQLTAWTAYPGDTEPANDTATADLTIVPGTVVMPGYYEDFESFGLCATTNNCGVEVCNLINGWRNYPNGTADTSDWRVNSGGTPSIDTGPATDFDPGTPSGKYLYVEASVCFNQEAIVESPCIDLSGLQDALLIFSHHMWGANMGNLSIDVFHGGNWTNNVWTLSGDQGNQWYTDTVNLASYLNSVISIRFRAVTGPNYDSDIAIDGVMIHSLSQKPSVAFSQSDSTICSQGVVSFSNESIYDSNWTWLFTPNTITFLNGTTAGSEHPVVQFNAPGIYDIQLIASNSFGSDTLLKSGAVVAGAGLPLPVYENFESQSLCAVTTDCGVTQCPLVGNWRNLTNGAGDDIDWRVNTGPTVSANTGPSTDYDPGTGKYIYLEASNGCNNQEAILLSDCIDLAGTIHPQLVYAYHMYGANMGTLTINLITADTVYQNITAGKAGNWGDLWIPDTADLSPYIGKVVKIQIIGTTGNGFASDLAIDGLLIEDASPPVAGIIAPDTMCLKVPEYFFDNTFGTVDSLIWDFGSNAIPMTAKGAGPHAVQFTNTGTYMVTLTAYNDVGTDQAMHTVEVIDRPVADFTYQTNNMDITLNNTTTGADSYGWLFGDGNGSPQSDPVHTYALPGTYLVELVATNQCGADTAVQEVIIIPEGIFTPDGWQVAVYPNPGDGLFTLDCHIPGTDEVSLFITDAAGRQVWGTRKFQAFGYSTEIVDLRSLPSGIYHLHLITGNARGIYRLVIQ